MKHHCGTSIEPQFGRSGVCSPDDWQCSSCEALDLEARIAELEVITPDCRTCVCVGIDYDRAYKCNSSHTCINGNYYEFDGNTDNLWIIKTKP